MNKRARSERWRALWRQVGASGSKSDGAYDDLARRYSEPHRSYHTLSHLDHCLTELDSATRVTADKTAVEFALWFHDAVYNPRAMDNEERSAQLAITVLASAELCVHYTDNIGDLIRSTKHDQLPGRENREGAARGRHRPFDLRPTYRSF